VVAALADAVHEVVQLTGDAVEPPPEFGEAWDNSFMQGIGRRNDAFVTLLDLERVFRSHELDLVEPVP
jgi:purine-binding chemotaxis protein CheW